MCQSVRLCDAHMAYTLPMVCNDIPRDIPERDPPRTYIRTYVRMYVHMYFVRIDPQFRASR